MFKSKRNIPLYLVLVISIICALIMLMGRVVAEGQSRKVACAISYDDILALSDEAGMVPLKWVKELKSAGLSYLILTDENEKAALDFANEAGLRYGRSGARAQDGDAFLMPHMEEGALRAYDAFEGGKEAPLILVEDITRTGVVMPEGQDLQSLEQPLVKGFYLYRNYSSFYHQGASPCEPENILFRAVFERGMRLAILSPLVSEEGIEADSSAYANMISGLAERIGARGFSLGEEFSIYNAPSLNPWLLAGALLLLPALLCILLRLLFALPNKAEWLGLLVCSLIIISIALWMPEMAQKFGALIGMILFGFLFAVVLSREAEEGGFFLKMQSPYRQSLCLLLSALAIGVFGGLYIGALLGTKQYMIGSSVFFGVKLSQLAPIGAVVILLIFAFMRKKEYLNIFEDKKRLGLKILALVLAFGAVLAVLILRSGDTTLLIADLEVRARNWMEIHLYARPRTKEFLVAFPAMSLFIFSCRRKAPLLKLFFGSLAGIGCVSILNTFCHIVTPVQISLVRSLIGAGIGLLLGWILLWVLMLLTPKKQREA